MSFTEEFESPNKDKPRSKPSSISSGGTHHWSSLPPSSIPPSSVPPPPSSSRRGSHGMGGSRGSHDSGSSVLSRRSVMQHRLTVGNLEIAIEKVGLKDYKRVAKTLCLAFNKDPFVNYILNTKINYSWDKSLSEDEVKKLTSKKNELFQAFYEMAVVEYIAYGGMVIVIKDVDFELNFNSNLSNYPFLAAACWNNMKFDNSLSLDYDEIDLLDSTASKFLLLKTDLKFNYLAFLNNCRQKSLKEKLPFLNNIRNSILINLNLNLNFKNKFNHIWYLSDIGVLPSMVGKSLGKILINYCIDNFVSHASWIYLESSNIINRQFYTKLGFKVANTFAINEDELIVNNIDIESLSDLKILNNFNDFILLDAMFKPPININIEREHYKVTTIDAPTGGVTPVVVSNIPNKNMVSPSVLNNNHGEPAMPITSNHDLLSKTSIATNA